MTLLDSHAKKGYTSPRKQNKHEIKQERLAAGIIRTAQGEKTYKE